MCLMRMQIDDHFPRSVRAGNLPVFIESGRYVFIILFEVSSVSAEQESAQLEEQIARPTTMATSTCYRRSRAWYLVRLGAIEISHAVVALGSRQTF